MKRSILRFLGQSCRDRATDSRLLHGRGSWQDQLPEHLCRLEKHRIVPIASDTVQVELVTMVPSGGTRDIGIAAHDGKAYRLMIRPLLPDESPGEVARFDFGSRPISSSISGLRLVIPEP